MRIQTPVDLSAVVRQARKQAGLTQAQLAERVGVGRLWVVRFEQGKAEVELGIALRALRVLGLVLEVSPPSGAGESSGESATTFGPVYIDLDALLRDAHGT